jgi:hypothetical protein
MAMVALTIVFINLRRLVKHDQLATTTSISFTIVAFCGVLFGAGHAYTPARAGMALRNGVVVALWQDKRMLSSAAASSWIDVSDPHAAMVASSFKRSNAQLRPAQPLNPPSASPPRLSSAWSFCS